MPFRLALLALFLFTVPAGAQEGRDANERFRAEEFEAALAGYRAGIAASDAAGDAAGAVRSALLNNLGMALYVEQEFADAQAAFEAALAAALTAADRARAAYNAGNAAARQQNFEAALGFYRRALLARPDYEDAAFNYEYIKRQLQDDQPTPPEPSDIQPSPFAERLKAEADSLVAAQQYLAALDVMQQGFAVDSTVQAYGEFVGRLGAVVEIENASGATLDLP